MIHGVENEGEGKKTGCVTSLQPLAEGSSTHIFPKEHAPIEPARGEDSPSQLSVSLCDPPLFGLRRQCLQLSLLVPCLGKDPTALWSRPTSPSHARHTRGTAPAQSKWEYKLKG